MCWTEIGELNGLKKFAESFSGKPKKKETKRKARRKLRDIINMDLRGIKFGSMTRIRVAQDRSQWQVLVSTVMKLRIL